MTNPSGSGPALESLLDGAGFFLRAETWTPALATRLAQLDGLQELTREHWDIIAALREHYRRFGAAPPAFAHICSRLHHDTHCVVRLFRSEREAWRIAGLPDPGEEARAYM
ncbi:MAG: TusE/DsrC/DsvC family sulfur relay protein [Pseudomonadota bacterium]